MAIHKLLIAALALSIGVNAKASIKSATKPSINGTLEFGVETECKTCPYTLCTNKAFYGYDTQVTLTCWTEGTSIANDTTWLKTTDGCYVTQYDLTQYNGTWKKDLNYCGKVRQKLTYDDAVVQFDTECNICPDNYLCETVKYLAPETDLTLTCWTAEGETVLNNPLWAKTTDNCYVSQTGLEDRIDKTALDNCGPVGFIQLNYTDGSSSVTTLPKAIGKNMKGAKGKGRKTGKPVEKGKPIGGPAGKGEAAIPTRIPVAAKPPTALSKRYLLNITVGEDYAVCYDCPSSKCDVDKRYKFNHPVYVQCYTDTGSTVANETYWYLTTDFCYVREGDFWESLFDQYRFPACSNFENADSEKKRKAKAKALSDKPKS